MPAVNLTEYFRLGNRFFRGQHSLAEKVKAKKRPPEKPAAKPKYADPAFRCEAMLCVTETADLYRATHVPTGRTVVVKQPYTPFRFLAAREAEFLSRLDHPNIVRLVAGRPEFLVEEYLPGFTLNKLSPTPLETAVAGRQIADALAHMHARGVVMRDLKPDNIMALPDGTVKLFDFGLAKDPRSPSDLDRAGAFFGTPEYAAPELIRSGAVVATAAADYFAFGLTLYYCLTGGFPVARRISLKNRNAEVSFPESGHPLDVVNLERRQQFIRPLLAGLLEPDPNERLVDPVRIGRMIEDAIAGAPGSDAEG